MHRISLFGIRNHERSEMLPYLLSTFTSDRAQDAGDTHDIVGLAILFPWLAVPQCTVFRTMQGRGVVSPEN